MAFRTPSLEHGCGPRRPPRHRPRQRPSRRRRPRRPPMRRSIRTARIGWARTLWRPRPPPPPPPETALGSWLAGPRRWSGRSVGSSARPSACAVWRRSQGQAPRRRGMRPRRVRSCDPVLYGLGCSIARRTESLLFAAKMARRCCGGSVQCRPPRLTPRRAQPAGRRPAAGARALRFALFSFRARWLWPYYPSS